VPDGVGLRQDTTPIEIPFEQIGVAEANAVRGAEFDEVTGSLVSGFVEDPEVLAKLRMRRVVVHKIANKDSFLGRCVSNQPDGAQEIRIEIRFELAQMTPECTALDKETGSAPEDTAAQCRDQSLHVVAVVSGLVDPDPCAPVRYEGGRAG
jgi:hypothetical protein